MNTLLPQPQPAWRRTAVYRREIVREGRATSLLAADAHVPSPPPSPAVLVAQMAAQYFGALASSCARLVVASATDERGRHDASCGFVLHPTAAGRLPLIRLENPQMKTGPGYSRLTYRILGGLLVRTVADRSGRSGFGSFSFEVMVTGTSATFVVRVDDFAARILGGGTSVLHRLVYQGTEALVHRVLVAGFLRDFVRSLPS